MRLLSTSCCLHESFGYSRTAIPTGCVIPLQRTATHFCSFYFRSDGDPGSVALLISACDENHRRMLLFHCCLGAADGEVVTSPANRAAQSGQKLLSFKSIHSTACEEAIAH